MQRTYTLTITIDDKGNVQSMERNQGLFPVEIITLLEMRKMAILNQITTNSTTIAMPNIIQDKEE